MIAIDQSDHLTDLFRQLQAHDHTGADLGQRPKAPLMLIKDNQTRWLGTYYMIKRAIKLRQYIEYTRVKYQQEWNNEHTSSRTGALRPSAKLPPFLQPCNQLSDADWQALGRISIILKDFEDCLIQLEGDGQVRRRSSGFEGSYGNIYHYLSGFEFILQKLEQYKEDARNYPDPIEYSVGINAAWAKVNNYYTTLHHTPIYYAAHVFHPAHRWSSLERLWPTNPEWVHDAKKQIKEVWEDEYRVLDITNPRPATPTIPQPLPHVNNFTSFLQQQRGRIDNDPFDKAELGNEYTRWYQIGREAGDYEVSDPIQYWHNHREQYPRLSRMALDFLTIQSMSAECERLFSAAGHLLDASRSRLDIRLVDLSMRLRSWYRAGIIENIDPMFLSITEEAEQRELAMLSMEEAEGRVTSWLRTGDPDQ